MEKASPHWNTKFSIEKLYLLLHVSSPCCSWQILLCTHLLNYKMDLNMHVLEGAEPLWMGAEYSF